MEIDLTELLKSCTVKLSIPNKTGGGTGFFVAPDRILTCAHVVKAAGFETIKVNWQDREGFPTATTERLIESSDLALLKLNSSVENLPWVDLDREIDPNDNLYAFGYPDDFPNGAPVTFSYEGLTGDRPPLIKFKLGQVRPGLSGSPLLNLRTEKVCGMVKFTRDRGTDLGGGGIPMTVILSEFRELEEWQKEFYQRNQTWSDCVKNVSEITSEPILTMQEKYLAQLHRQLEAAYSKLGRVDGAEKVRVQSEVNELEREIRGLSK